MKKLLLMMLGMLMALPTFAYDFDYTYEGQTLTYTVISEDDKTVLIKCAASSNTGNSISGDLIIPATVKDGVTEYTVTEIGRTAFYNCISLTSVTIPNSVQKIGGDAFHNCSGLTKAEFASIESLCSIEFADLASNPIYRAYHLYIDGKEVTDLVIPETVTSIGNYAFYNCRGLTSVFISNSVQAIGNYAFEGCSGLTKAEFASIESLCSIEFGNSTSNPLNCARHLYIDGKEVTNLMIPEKVNSIGNYAFNNCSGLTSVTIGNSVQTIGNGAFSGCSGLKSVTIGNSVQTIGDDAFSYCYGLTSVTIGNSVQTIGNHAFERCNSLTSIAISNSVQTIGYYAFYKCSYLTSVTIGHSVQKICYSAFEDCSRLTKVEFASVESLCSIEFENYLSNPLNYAQHLYIKDLYIEVKEVTDLVIPETVTSIGNYAFNKCIGLISVTIGNSVTAIGSYAFNSCSGLKSVTIGKSVQTIGNYAFDGCISLTSVTFPNSVISIGDYAFYYCKELTSVAIGNSVTTIGSSAFSSCSGLTSVTIPNSVQTIGDKAFSACTGLTEVTIPNSVISIGGAAFYYCSGLTSLSIGNSVQTIGSSAFSNCSNLTSVTIPNSVQTINNYAFSKCTGLTEVNVNWDKPIALSSTSFDSSTYNNAILNIPANSVPSYISSSWWKLFKNHTAGGYAVKDCADDDFNYVLVTNPENQYAILVSGDYSAVTTANIPARFTDLTDEANPVSYMITSIGPNAFSNCNGLTEVNIPNSVETIGESAFSYCSGLAELTIPDSVTSIGSYAFNGCTGLTTVFYNAVNPISADSNCFSNGTYSKATLFVNDVAKEKCKEIDPWKNFAKIQGNSSGIEDIDTDTADNTPCVVYSLSGVKIGNSMDNLPAGTYIVRQGGKVKKIVVK